MASLLSCQFDLAQIPEFLLSCPSPPTLVRNLFVGLVTGCGNIRDVSLIITREALISGG